MNTRLPVADRRAQLVGAALDVASAEGIAAATVRRVAEQAGVALGVVHYCFADKDELFTELATRIVDDLARAGAEAIAATLASEFPDRPADVATVLHAAVAGLWAGIESAPGAQLLTYEITTHALRQPELHPVAARQYEVSQAAVASLLALVADVTGTRWTQPLAEITADTLAVVDGVTLRWLVDRDAAAAFARLSRYADRLCAQAKRRRSGPRRRVTSGEGSR